MDPFFGRSLKDITKEDLQRLINDAVKEDFFLEYKRDLPLSDREGKKEFLRDITAFANAEGGLLIFGMDEERDAADKPTGIASRICGLTVSEGQLILQIESLLRDGVDERLPTLEIHPLLIAPGEFVLLTRVAASLRSPHMVKMGDSGFYLRVNGGKETMSTAQIRGGILRTDAISSRVRSFLDDRRQWLQKYVPAAEKDPFLTLHILPLRREAGRIDVTNRKVLEAISKHLDESMYGSGIWTHNIDGYSLRGTSNYPISWVTVFRDGAIEYLEFRHVQKVMQPFNPNDSLLAINGVQLVHRLAIAVKKATELYGQLGIAHPLVVALRLERLGTVWLQQAGQHWDSQRFGPEPVWPEPIILATPGVLPAEAIREPLNVLWNAAGLERCGWFDRAGTPLFQL